MRTSPDTPATHPIILHTDLHAEDERAPQTQFVVERQVAFLEALATTGSVRAAAPSGTVAQPLANLGSDPVDRSTDRAGKGEYIAQDTDCSFSERFG